jgi:hypothetical protein
MVHQRSSVNAAASVNYSWTPTDDATAASQQIATIETQQSPVSVDLGGPSESDEQVEREPERLGSVKFAAISKGAKHPCAQSLDSISQSNSASPTLVLESTDAVMDDGRWTISEKVPSDWKVHAPPSIQLRPKWDPTNPSAPAQKISVHEFKAIRDASDPTSTKGQRMTRSDDELFRRRITWSAKPQVQEVRTSDIEMEERRTLSRHIKASKPSVGAPVNPLHTISTQFAIEAPANTF